jgi:hypothetical protein
MNNIVYGTPAVVSLHHEGRKAPVPRQALQLENAPGFRTLRYMHADIDATNRLFRLSVFLVTFLLTFSATARAADFQTWLAGFRREAAAAGV